MSWRDDELYGDEYGSFDDEFRERYDYGDDDYLDSDYFDDDYYDESFDESDYFGNYYSYNDLPSPGSQRRAFESYKAEYAPEMLQEKLDFLNKDIETIFERSGLLFSEYPKLMLNRSDEIEWEDEDDIEVGHIDPDDEDPNVSEQILPISEYEIKDDQLASVVERWNDSYEEYSGYWTSEDGYTNREEWVDLLDKTAFLARDNLLDDIKQAANSIKEEIYSKKFFKELCETDDELTFTSNGDLIW